MSSDLPVVLFVDEDEEAMNRILVKLEPILLAFSLRSVGMLHRYIDKIRPDIIVLSDRLQYRKKDAPGIVAELREGFQGPILMLTECIDERVRALWRERGADDCILHPTRQKERLNELSRKIVDLAASKSAQDG